MSVTLSNSDGQVSINELADGRKHIFAKPNDPALFVPVAECTTAYPSDLIEHIFNVKGLAWLCDEIGRDEDANYVQRLLLNDLYAYFLPGDFSGKRILDFGCGSGASTAILARTFPDADIVGVELVDDLLSIAKKRVEFYGLSNVTLLRSPSGSELPPNLGEFEVVIMSAVVEHLLPSERGVILPMLWSSVKPGGFLFLDQTPNRAFPFELHTTMLPFINYLPDKIAHQYARTFSKRIDKSDSWESLLRQGIRGATVSEITRQLSIQTSKPLLIEPDKNGIKDRVDLWYQNTNPQNMAVLKSVAKILLKAVRSTTGISFVSDLSLLFQKPKGLSD